MNHAERILATRLARTTDPICSHLAAERVSTFAGDHKAVILKALRKHGAMTVDEIAVRTGLQSQQINKRLPEMQRESTAAPTNLMRKSNSGVMERVWRCVRGSK